MPQVPLTLGTLQIILPLSRTLSLVGLNQASAALLERLATHDKPGAAGLPAAQRRMAPHPRPAPTSR